MSSVSVSQLKARLSEHLRRVRSGERLVVTDRGSPVAMLVPLDAADIPDEMTELIDEGLVRPPTRTLPRDFWERPRPADRESALRRAVDEERSGGW